MKKILVLLFSLIALKGEALTLVEADGRLTPPLVELLQLFDLPIDRTVDETAQILRSVWIQEGKERWQYEDRYSDKKEQALPLLSEIGCFDAVHAGQLHYDYALVTGGLASRVEKRLNFLFEEWQRGVRFEALIFLTGQRDIDPIKEPLPPGVDSESQMMIRIYRAHPLSKAALDLPVSVIDTSKQIDTMRRPNRADTVNAWLKTRPQPGSCLSISSQPFVGYDEAILRGLLPPEFSFEVVGEADEGRFPLVFYLDNIAKWLLNTKN